MRKEELNPELVERLKAIMSHFSFTQTEMAERVGIRQPSLSDILKLKRPCGEAVVNKFVITLGINKGWLLTGQGSMLQPEKNAEYVGGPNVDEGLKPLKVRFFEINPSATFTEMASCFNEGFSYIDYIPLSKEAVDQTFAIFKIHGDSMLPTLPNRAKILCKELVPSRWHEAKRVIVIAFGDSVVVKRVIKNRLLQDNYIEIGSDNPEFKETVKVPLSEIRSIFQAYKVLEHDI